jgi:hypothetical protein
MHGFYLLYFPPNTTHLLQPVDHHVGAFMKTFLAKRWQEQSEELQTLFRKDPTGWDVQRGVQVKRVSMLLWVKQAWEMLQRRPKLLLHAFTSTGILFGQNGEHRIKINELRRYDPLFFQPLAEHQQLELPTEDADVGPDFSEESEDPDTDA